MNKIILAALAILLVGCGTTKTEVRTEYVYREMPAALLQTFHRVPPPQKEVYLEMSCDAREKTWMDIYRLQDTALYQYNTQVENQRIWDSKQKSLFDKTKEAP